MKKLIIGAFIVEGIALVLGILSSGAGHGSYFLAKVFFPWEMYVGQVQNYIRSFSMISSLIHYPAIIIPVGFIKPLFLKISYITIILIIHALFWYLTFTFPSTNFG